MKQLKLIMTALCLSAVIGIGDAAFASGILLTTGERIDIAARDPDATGKRLFGRRADGSAPIHDAAREGNARQVRHFLSNGENPNVQMKNGRTPLHLATTAEVVRDLLRSGANMELREEYGKSPLHFAAGFGKDEVAKALIEAGARIEAKDRDTRTPLHWAAHEGKAGTAELLLSKGAERDVIDKHGRTPFQMAFDHGFGDAALVLAKAGARGAFVNKAEKFGRQYRPLHLAAANNKPKMAQALVVAEADIEAVSDIRHTPLHVAALHNSPEVAKILIKAGANPYARSQSAIHNNERPIDIAIRVRAQKVEQLLRAEMDKRERIKREKEEEEERARREREHKEWEKKIQDCLPKYPRFICFIMNW